MNVRSLLVVFVLIGCGRQVDLVDHSICFRPDPARSAAWDHCFCEDNFEECKVDPFCAQYDCSTGRLEWRPAADLSIPLDFATPRDLTVSDFRWHPLDFSGIDASLTHGCGAMRLDIVALAMTQDKAARMCQQERWAAQGFATWKSLALYQQSMEDLYALPVHGGCGCGLKLLADVCVKGNTQIVDVDCSARREFDALAFAACYARIMAPCFAN